VLAVLVRACLLFLVLPVLVLVVHLVLVVTVLVGPLALPPLPLSLSPSPPTPLFLSPALSVSLPPPWLFARLWLGCALTILLAVLSTVVWLCAHCIPDEPTHPPTRACGPDGGDGWGEAARPTPAPLLGTGLVTMLCVKSMI
jgi:hypothetical protein